ncbi:MAG: virulence factor [Acidimicrobiia bacterium]|nr:virulence factor [Acidimicrobiia bacterium]
MAQLITIWWRDIPAQVTARDGRRKAAVQLSERFQVAIDRAAARAGKTTTDEYLAEWRRETSDCGPDLAAEADRAAADLEAAFPDEELRRYVRSGGVRPKSEQEEHA